MKSSRVLVVAVLAVLCLATVSNATVITLTNTSYGKFSTANGYTYEPNTLSDLLGSYRFLNVKYDLSAVISDLAAGNTIVSATLYYERGYTGGHEVAQATVTVAQSPEDPVTETTFWNLVHKNSSDVCVLQGANVISAADVVTGYDNTGAAYEGARAGLQSIDITAIVESWTSGSANYGVNIGTSLDWEALLNSELPYIVVTTAAPEPMTMGLLAVGGIAALLRRRRMA